MRLTKDHFRRARLAAASLSRYGAEPVSVAILRDAIDARLGGDLTGPELDRLIDHCRNRVPAYLAPEDRQGS